MVHFCQEVRKIMRRRRRECTLMSLTRIRFAFHKPSVWCKIIKLALDKDWVTAVHCTRQTSSVYVYEYGNNWNTSVCYFKPQPGWAVLCNACHHFVVPTLECHMATEWNPVVFLILNKHGQKVVHFGENPYLHLMPVYETPAWASTDLSNRYV